jgi:hypothetical protein
MTRLEQTRVDGETVPDVATGSPEFFLWEE